MGFMESLGSVLGGASQQWDKVQAQKIQEREMFLREQQASRAEQEFARKKQMQNEMDKIMAERQAGIMINPDGSYTDAGQAKATGLMGQMAPGMNATEQNADIMGEGYAPAPEWAGGPGEQVSPISDAEMAAWQRQSMGGGFVGNFDKAGQMLDPNAAAIQAITPDGMTPEQLRAPVALPMNQTASYAQAKQNLDPYVAREMAQIQRMDAEIFQQEKLLPLIMRFNPEEGLKMQAMIEDKRQARADKASEARYRAEKDAAKSEQAERFHADKMILDQQKLLQRLGRGGSGGGSGSGGSGRIVLTAPADPEMKQAGVKEVRDAKTKELQGYEIKGRRMSVDEYNSDNNSKYEIRTNGYADEDYKSYVSSIEAQAMTDPSGAYKRARDYGYTDADIKGYKGFKNIWKKADGSYNSKAQQQNTQGSAGKDSFGYAKGEIIEKGGKRYEYTGNGNVRPI